MGINFISKIGQGSRGDTGWGGEPECEFAGYEARRLQMFTRHQFAGETSEHILEALDISE
jgi:hypothetical protein